MIHSYTEIKEKICKVRQMKKISIAKAESESVIRAVMEVEKLHIARGLFVGDAEKIKTIAHEVGFAIDPEFIIHETDDEKIAQKSVQLINDGKADVLMKGQISTPILMKAVLNKDNGLRTGEVLSHVAVAETPTYPKLLVFSDGGINILPDFETKKSILRSIIHMNHALENYQPKIGALCAIEQINPKMPETIDAAELQKLSESGEFDNAIVEGPIAMDVALSAKAALKKGIDSKIAGDIDSFLVPNITAGNALIKILMKLAHAKVGGIVVGAKVPIILLSRSDTANEKLNSISLAILLTL
ncbi:MAG: phosphate butyryltransferase [Candidatus Marinimicrobia bacterium]|nr:phosphate butyryltransferase [Candidatus Neomarinimicrobiota bacterium]